jgi:hypothetical protein
VTDRQQIIEEFAEELLRVWEEMRGIQWMLPVLIVIGWWFLLAHLL